MKIISWNLNSIRVRINQVIELLDQQNPDILCLQETKIVNNQFPKESFMKKGYISYFNGIPSYNGVAILSKKKGFEKTINLCEKDDARYLSLKTEKIEIISVYVPAGGNEPDEENNPKFKHKLFFLDELSKLLKKKRGEKIVLCGDLNVAPYEDDVWSHKSLTNVVSHTEGERERIVKLLDKCDLVDSIRCFLNPPQNIFTWWSYRSPNYKTNNRGRRLDHIFAASRISNKITSAAILDDFRDKEKPSDHVPIMIQIDI